MQQPIRPNCCGGFCDITGFFISILGVPLQLLSNAGEFHSIMQLSSRAIPQVFVN
jgi:hypothetical protein